MRKKIFCDDTTIYLCKNAGINSNWDLTFVVYCFAKILETLDFAKIAEKIKSLNTDAFGIYGYLEKKGYIRSGERWNYLRDIFQQIYLGDILYKKNYNKEPSISGIKGLMDSEVPMFDIERTALLLDSLKKKGYILGIATGRTGIEITDPLKKWDLIKYFDPKSIVTYDHVEQVEANIGVTVTKPHPYCFIKAFLGIDFSDQDIINGNYNFDTNHAIAVGDAGADILAAKTAGMKFVAVLTGVQGKSAQSYFEEKGADMILDNVLELDKRIDEI